jgi:RNA polymerase-binding transcription factor DksA
MTNTMESGIDLAQRDRFHGLLVADRASATDLIDALKGGLNSFSVSQRGVIAADEHDPEGPSIAVQRSESAVMLAQARQHLDEINAAMARLDDGSYGVCEGCGRSIPLARLRARPQATRCISCAQSLGI